MRDTYISIAVDKRKKPFTYRLQIITILPNGKRKTKLHQSFSGENGKSLAKLEKSRLENELRLGNTIIEKDVTVEDYFNDFILIKSKLKSWTGKYCIDCKKIANQFSVYCKLKKIKFLSEIKINHIEQFIFEFGSSKRQFNRHLTFLKSVFKKAHDDEIILKNPTKRITKIKETEKISTKPLTDTQIKSILNYLDTRFKWFKPIFRLALYTGMRGNELCLLKWDYIDFQNYKITLPANITKGKYERIIPLHPEAKKILIEYSVNRIDDFALRNGEGNPCKIDNLSHTFAKIAKYFEFPKGIKLHSTRATFITKALQSGDTIATQAIVGHQDLATTQGYTEAFESAKKAVIDSITF